MATQDPELRKHFRGHYEYVVNYFTFLAQEVREYLAEMGFTRLEDIIGRTDLIEIQQAPSEKKSSLLDFSRLLHRVDNGAAIHHVMEQKHDIAHVKDVTILAVMQIVEQVGGMEKIRAMGIGAPCGNYYKAFAVMMPSRPFTGTAHN